MSALRDVVARVGSRTGPFDGELSGLGVDPEEFKSWVQHETLAGIKPGAPLADSPPHIVVTASLINGFLVGHEVGSQTAVQFVLDGLGVPSLAELHRLVERGRSAPERRTRPR